MFDLRRKPSHPGEIFKKEFMEPLRGHWGRACVYAFNILAESQFRY
jgi:hypothetical protein